MIYNELIIKEGNKLKFREDLVFLMTIIALKIKNCEEINYNEIEQFFENVGKDLNYDRARNVAENIINRLKEVDFENKELQNKILIKRLIKYLEKRKEYTKNRLNILKKVISGKYEDNLVDLSLLTEITLALTEGRDLNGIILNLLAQFKRNFEMHLKK